MQFQDLYTIIDTKYTGESNSFNKRIKPGNEDHHQINNFTNNFLNSFVFQRQTLL